MYKLCTEMHAVSLGNSYNDSERCVCAGYDNGDIKLFDLRTLTQQWGTNIRNGVSGAKNNILHVCISARCIIMP